ncbi:MAG: 30S ribosomal protein S20 [Hyphomicrobiales bacterium]|nr:30S ribosomal protein S20 [Hyphomicrobiales bacterium]
MANTSSAKKAVRKITHRTAVNKARRSEMRTQLRKVEEALSAGNAAAATAAMAVAAPLLMRASQKGIIHKNTASRKVSRLNIRMKKLAQA